MIPIPNCDCSTCCEARRIVADAQLKTLAEELIPAPPMRPARITDSPNRQWEEAPKVDDMTPYWTGEPPKPVADLTDADLVKAMAEAVGLSPPAPASLLPTDSETRKCMPITSGVIDYFPKALAYVAMISKAGNDKHNPGQPLHWSRDKSGDHADCIVRHLIERGTRDAEDRLRHSGKLAWRALANLQLELEAAEEKGEEW